MVQERRPAGILQAEGARYLDRNERRVPDRRDSTKTAPSVNSASVRRASSVASRVLPAPPGPVSVSSREPASRRRASASSFSRPTKLVGGCGNTIHRCTTAVRATVKVGTDFKPLSTHGPGRPELVGTSRVARDLERGRMHHHTERIGSLRDVARTRGVAKAPRGRRLKACPRNKVKPQVRAGFVGYHWVRFLRSVSAECLLNRLQRGASRVVGVKNGEAGR